MKKNLEDFNNCRLCCVTLLQHVASHATYYILLLMCAKVDRTHYINVCTHVTSDYILQNVMIYALVLLYNASETNGYEPNGSEKIIGKIMMHNQ